MRLHHQQSDTLHGDGGDDRSLVGKHDGGVKGHGGVCRVDWVEGREREHQHGPSSSSERFDVVGTSLSWNV